MSCITLYSDVFFRKYSEIETFCCRNSKSFKYAKDKDECWPSSQGLMETWLQVWQDVPGPAMEVLAPCCCSGWTNIDCQPELLTRSCAHAAPLTASPESESPPAAAPASWPRPACCVFNLHRPLSQVGSRRKQSPCQFDQDGMGSIPATPSTKHA